MDDFFVSVSLTTIENWIDCYIKIKLPLKKIYIHAKITFQMREKQLNEKIDDKNTKPLQEAYQTKHEKAKQKHTHTHIHTHFDGTWCSPWFMFMHWS